MTLAASNEIFWKFDKIVIFEICSSLLQSLSKLTPVFKRIFSTSFSIFPIYFLKNKHNLNVWYNTKRIKIFNVTDERMRSSNLQKTFLNDLLLEINL